MTEPARETPVHAETEVLVVGGGPAGCAAALAARRAGAEVLLVERYNHLGGLSTGGLVIWIDRMTDWSGRSGDHRHRPGAARSASRTAVAGAPRALWGSTDADAVAYWRERQGAFRDTVTWSPMIDPEWLKYLSAELLIEAGVKFLLHSWVGGSARRGPRRPRRDVREQAGAARDPGRRGRRLHRRPRPVRAGGRSSSRRTPRRAAGGIAHCLNTGWLWAGVDFARWLEFKRDDPAAPPAS